MAGISVSRGGDFRTLSTGKKGETYLLTVTEIDTGGKTVFACSGEQAEVLFRLYRSQTVKEYDLMWR